MTSKVFHGKQRGRGRRGHERGGGAQTRGRHPRRCLRVTRTDHTLAESPGSLGEPLVPCLRLHTWHEGNECLYTDYRSWIVGTGAFTAQVVPSIGLVKRPKLKSRIGWGLAFCWVGGRQRRFAPAQTTTSSLPAATHVGRWKCGLYGAPGLWALRRLRPSLCRRSG